MYNVSAEYLEKINSSSKQVDWFGKVTLTNGTQILFDSSNLSAGQTSITRQLCDSSTIKIGCACASELKIAFMLDYDEENNLYYFNEIEVNKYDFYDAKIDLTFRLFFDDERYEDIPFNTFIATDVERSRMILTCTAYDFMTKFMESCVSTIQGSPYNVLLNACSVCGVEFGNSPSDIRNMVNGTSTLVEYDPNNLIQTWRDVVGFVAGFLCGNAVIKNDNKLYIIPYDQGEYREISADNRKSLTIADFVSNYQTITATFLRTNTEIKATKGDGMTYKMGSNPLMQYVTPLVSVGIINNILDILCEMPYVPFNGQFFTDPSFELGDRVNFTDNHAGESTLSVVTKIVIKINGAMEMSCEGDDPYKQKAEEIANKEKASETNGSVGDGVTFYDDYVSDEVTIEGGDSETFFTITYDSNGDYRNEFAAQILAYIETTEELANNEYTLEDCRIRVIYYINGQEVANYRPVVTLTDGSHVINLLYVWTSDLRIAQSTLEVVLDVIGGDAILKGQARIMQSGTAYVAPSNELEYIEADESTYYSLYYPGETIDFSGIVVWAYYEDGSREDVASQCTFNPPSGTPITDEKAAFTVDIVYVKDNKEYKTNITLEVDYLIAISVDKEPTKDEYFVGDTLDLSGAKIMATYSVSKDKDKTSSCTFVPSDGTVITSEMLSGNVLNVNVSYTEHGITKGCQMPLTVMPVGLEEIRIDTPPTKTTYKVGENIDLTGMVVNAYYSDGTITNVTQSCTYEPGNGSAVSFQTSVLKATYTEGGKSFVDTCDLTVITFDGIAVTTLPNKTKYWYGSGEVMDYTGMVVTGTWSDGTTEDVTEQCTVSPASGSAVTMQTSAVTVSYANGGTTYTDTFNVEVGEAEPVVKYLVYTINTQARTINVSALDVEAISQDQLQNLFIPATYTDPESGIEYTLILRTYSN